MAYFLVKSDPDTYSLDDLERDKQTEWDGVHNYQAINFIKTMKPGDKVFVYHSQKDKAIVGVAEVASKPYQNTTDTRFSWAVRLKFLKRTKPVTLAEIKSNPELEKFMLVTHSRLSVMPVDPVAANWIDSRI